MTEDFGLVRRSVCVCGDVIIIASNASDELISTTLRLHANTARHLRSVDYDHTEGRSLARSRLAADDGRGVVSSTQRDRFGYRRDGLRSPLDAYESRLDEGS